MLPQDSVTAVHVPAGVWARTDHRWCFSRHSKARCSVPLLHPGSWRRGTSAISTLTRSCARPAPKLSGCRSTVPMARIIPAPLSTSPHHDPVPRDGASSPTPQNLPRPPKSGPYPGAPDRHPLLCPPPGTGLRMVRPRSPSIQTWGQMDLHDVPCLDGLQRRSPPPRPRLSHGVLGLSCNLRLPQPAGRPSRRRPCVGHAAAASGARLPRAP